MVCAIGTLLVHSYVQIIANHVLLPSDKALCMLCKHFRENAKFDRCGADLRTDLKLSKMTSTFKRLVKCETQSKYLLIIWYNNQ
jgi:hypothetical protein